MGIPFKAIVPCNSSVEFRRPHNARSKVDFPEPEGPSTSSVSPLLIQPLTLSNVLNALRSVKDVPKYSAPNALMLRKVQQGRHGETAGT